MIQQVCDTLKMLLVEDDPSMLRLLHTIVQRSFEGRVVVEACDDPAVALKWMDDNVVDILVTDLDMPGVSGLGVLRSAKYRNPCAQVIFVTGCSTPEAIMMALEFGATDYLLKPFDQLEFVGLIEDAEKRLRRWRIALAGTLAARADR